MYHCAARHPPLVHVRYVRDRYTDELLEELDHVVVLEHIALEGAAFDALNALLPKKARSRGGSRGVGDDGLAAPPGRSLGLGAAAAEEEEQRATLQLGGVAAGFSSAREVARERIATLQRATRPESMFLVDVGDVTRSADLVQCCRQRLAGQLTGRIAGQLAGQRRRASARGEEVPPLRLVAAFAGRPLPHSRKRWAELKRRWQRSSSIPRVTIFSRLASGGAAAEAVAV